MLLVLFSILALANAQSWASAKTFTDTGCAAADLQIFAAVKSTATCSGSGTCSDISGTASVQSVCNQNLPPIPSNLAGFATYTKEGCNAADIQLFAGYASGVSCIVNPQAPISYSFTCSATGAFELNTFSTNDCSGTVTPSASVQGCVSTGGISFRSTCSEGVPGSVLNTNADVNITVTFQVSLTADQIARLSAALTAYANNGNLVITVTATAGSPLAVFNIVGVNAGATANGAVGNTVINADFFTELDNTLPATRSATVGNTGALVSASGLFLALAALLALIL